MKLLIRIVLIAIAIAVAIPVGLFLAGFFGVLLGILEPPEKTEAETEVTAEAEIQPYRKPIALPSSEPPDAPEATEIARPEFQSFDMSPFPEVVDEGSALKWLSENKLMLAAGDAISLDPARFSTLQADEALALLWAFKKQHDTAKGDRRRQLQMLAGLVFMGAAYMPEAERLAFAQDAQSVAWRGSGSGVDRHRSGEFVLMFFLKGEPYQPWAEAAIQRFAPMLPGSAILSALDRANAINVGKGYDETWTYAMDSIRHLSPDTLQALHDFIGPYDNFNTGDLQEFGYAKDRLADLIEERRTETGQ